MFSVPNQQALFDYLAIGLRGERPEDGSRRREVQWNMDVLAVCAACERTGTFSRAEFIRVAGGLFPS